eukprot:gb/GECG01010936.1/.p1 GENE.gb/GECG01010936.1/~~gb/GECG01010936.1/.p1  ORF type:complete len:331 (+),score=45.77 gb/GECG01010936.1/:1-993(+)
MLALRRALTSSVKRTIPVFPAFSQVLISKTRRSHEQGKTRWNNRMLATTAQASYGQEEAEVDDEHYEEVRQKQSIKPVDFYEYWAQQRRYFYYVDNQGRLFIEDVLPKNIATSLKSEKFLNFFWKQIRRNDQEEHQDYPYYSPCGKEKNYIKVADRPVVFHEIVDGHLVYGGALTIPFSPYRLYMTDTGRLYHCAEDTSVGGIGLVKSQIAVGVAQNILLMDQVESADMETMRQTMNDVQNRSDGDEKGSKEGRKKKKRRDPPPLDPLSEWSELSSDISNGGQLLEKLQYEDTIQGVYAPREDRIFPIWKAAVNGMAGDPFREFSEPITE